MTVVGIRVSQNQTATPHGALPLHQWTSWETSNCSSWLPTSMQIGLLADESWLTDILMFHDCAGRPSHPQSALPRK